jgi:hypothetical protein
MISDEEFNLRLEVIKLHLALTKEMANSARVLGEYACALEENARLALALETRKPGRRSNSAQRDAMLFILVHATMQRMAGEHHKESRACAIVAKKYPRLRLNETSARQRFRGLNDGTNLRHATARQNMFEFLAAWADKRR